ncbi:MAG TPA: peptidoglycan-binding protein, partial [Marinagarivorans sp.]
MPKGIMRSVGVKASNELGDVKLIQIYLNLNRQKNQKRLAEDGLIGKKTIDAIKHFQVNSVGMKNADGRVDPNGKTFSYLTMYIEASEQDAAEANARLNKQSRVMSPVSETKILSQAGLSHLSVSYKNIPAERQLVAKYSKNIIRVALKQAGMKHAVITSTLRFPEQQAEIMLRNAKIDLAKQFRLYGSAGDKVLKVFQDNKSKSDTEII